MFINDRMMNSTMVIPELHVYRSVNLELVALMIMLSIFSVVGSIGNGMVIFVFQRVRDKSTAQVFIITLAVIDLFTCMVVIPLTMFVEYTNNEIKYDMLCKLYQFFITSKIPMSAFIMVAIAFDRYFCICHPLRRIITIYRARAIVVCLALLGCLCGVVTSLFYSVYHTFEQVDVQKIDKAAGTNFTKYIANVDEIYTLNDRGHYYSSIRENIISTLQAKIAEEVNGTINNYLPITHEVAYTGICGPSSVMVRGTFFHIYHRTFMAVYPICLIIVMILYFMIYRFMCLRRSRKLKQKLIMCSYVNGDGTYENTKLVSGDIDDTRRNSKNTLMPVMNSPVHFARSVSDSNGFRSSAVNCRELQEQINTEGKQALQQESRRHDNNYLVEPIPRNKISSSPTITTNIVTPMDNDDNTPILSFSISHNNSFRHSTTDRSQLVSSRRQSRLQEQKYHWHKNRDSMKRYKGKTNRRKRHYSCDADRLREENRTANVRTALMLFTVTLVFMIAFVPSWCMAFRIIPHNMIVFYMYFVYNVANPFIYAFMNHIFKDYMRKVLTCRQFIISRRRPS